MKILIVLKIIKNQLIFGKEKTSSVNSKNKCPNDEEKEQIKEFNKLFNIEIG